jgi:hypothetical protein
MSRANTTVSCDGMCRYACTTGFADCDGNPANGCEVNLNTDAANCGACRGACNLANATAACMGGTCRIGTCTTGFADCDGNPANGCETNTQTDAANCSRCGALCATGDTCTASACNNIVRSTSGGHVGSIDQYADYLVARASAGNYQINNAAVFTFMERLGRYSIGRGYLLVRVPTGTLVSVTARFFPPYGAHAAGTPDMGVQGVSFTPTSMSAVGRDDFALTHWGAETFFSEAIPCTDFASGLEVRRTLNAAGVRYFQASAGRLVMFGLRTTYDLDGTPPTGGYAGVELGTPPPNVEVTISYRP